MTRCDLLSAGDDLLVRVVLFVVVLVLLIASGCGGSPDPYETEPGAATRLDGGKPHLRSVTIANSRRVKGRQVIFVRGYLLAPRDDRTRLCSRLEKGGACRDALVIDASRVNLDASAVLEAGCCSTGLWSHHPVVLRLQTRPGQDPLLLG